MSSTRHDNCNAELYMKNGPYRHPSIKSNFSLEDLNTSRDKSKDNKELIKTFIER